KRSCKRLFRNTPHTCGIRRALFPACGDTLFFLANQGREFFPGKFTGIDRMTATGGGQDISGTGLRSPVEVIFAPCQKPVVFQFKFQQWVDRGYSIKPQECRQCATSRPPSSQAGHAVIRKSRFVKRTSPAARIRA
ncbi:MAG: hypothetical protein WAM29_04520, partial [Methylocella sp.]